MRKKNRLVRKKPNATREQIIDALIEGLTNKQLHREFHGLAVGTIRAYRAHLTRGSYDQHR